MPKFYFSSNSGLIEIKRQSHSELFPNENLYILIGSNDLCNKDTFRIICENIIKLRERSPQLEFTPIVIISDLTNNEKSRKHFNSLFFNSSIWFRYVQSSQIEIELVKTNNELAFFRAKGLFEDPNAREFFDFHLRLQNQNYLNDGKSEGHGRNVTPVIYSDECDSIASIKKPNEAGAIQNKIPEIGLYNKVSYNILLVDDKPNKGNLIKDLLNQFQDDPELYTKTIWDDGNVVCEFFKQRYSEDEIDFINRIEKFKNDSSIIGKTKIFQVSSVKDTIRLLSNINLTIRFDLVLMDYLLDIDSSGKREYSTLLFKWFTENKNELTNDTFNLGLKDGELIRLIKDNRGPLQKIWIFPITAFNQTFIDDLRNIGVRLIDYYWYLGRGADPINTPYLFISTLNQFLQLQLENAVFSKGEIIVFIRKTIEKLDDVSGLDDYNAVMGAEYTIFAERYMTRAVAFRDEKAGSLFANYVLKNFHKNTDNKSLFILVQKIEKFYHCCTFGTEADMDKMIILHRELKTYLMENFPKLFKVSEIDKFYCKIVQIKSEL